MEDDQRVPQTCSRLLATLGVVALLGTQVRCAAASEADRTPSASSSVDDIFRAMRARYASCHTYTDKGECSNVFHFDDGDVFTKKITFETTFDRANGVRFEYAFDDAAPVVRRGAIWRDARGPAHVWSASDAVVQDKVETWDAICWLSGPSLGTARNVPAMLIGQTGQPYETQGFRVDGEEAIGNVQTIKVSRRDAGGAVTLWIGEQDHALLRLHDQHRDVLHSHAVTTAESALFVNLSDEEKKRVIAASVASSGKPIEYTVDLTVSYAPSFDGPIDPARFQFQPPVAPPHEH